MKVPRGEIPLKRCPGLAGPRFLKSLLIYSNALDSFQLLQTFILIPFPHFHVFMC